MAIATYKDLCIDAVDTDRMSRFWATVLALEPEQREGGLVKLVGATAEDTVWVVPVPEPVTVKQRAHLDIRAASEKDVEALGATVVDADSFPWVLMKDPEGGELCVFETDDKRHGLFELIIDSDRDPKAIARWWAEVFGARLHEEDDYAYLEEVPALPFETIDFVPVPEPKTVKNRVHFDVWGDVEALQAKGATVLRAPDDTIDWTIMADPDGNEFCVFSPEA
jgi:hypothetical protein